ncbi:TPA: hypothetical protein ACH3X1_015967 [Trebouxia sp. C0004]
MAFVKSCVAVFHAHDKGQLTGSQKRLIADATKASDICVELHSRFEARSDSMAAVDKEDYEIETPLLEVCNSLVALTRGGLASDIYTVQDLPTRFLVTVHVNGIAYNADDVSPTDTFPVPRTIAATGKTAAGCCGGHDCLS